jgi:hypothetical protein
MNIKELNKKTKKELIEDTRIYKRRAKIFLILAISIFVYLLYVGIQDIFGARNQLTDELKCQEQLNTYFTNETNMSISQFKKELCEETSITQSINAFFDKFLKLDTPWIFKFLLFLGALYLIQVTFALAMDLLEVLMLIVVATKRLYKWIKRLITKEDGKGK